MEEPKNPDTCNLFAIYRPFATPEELEQLEARYRAPGLKYSDAKKELLEIIWTYFEPFRKRREELAQNLDYVHEVLRKGADKARAIASVTLDKVRRNVGLAYH